MPNEISVTTGTDRPTAQEQLGRIIEAMQQVEGGQIKLRLPLSIHDPSDKNYAQVRDAYWNLQLPAHSATVEKIEIIIEALSKCILSIAEDGAQVTMDKLELALPVVEPPQETQP